MQSNKQNDVASREWLSNAGAMDNSFSAVLSEESMVNRRSLC